jgi:ribose transport system permease protein
VSRVAIADRQQVLRADSSATVSSRRRILDALSFRRIGAVYIFIALFILFSIWVPGTFLQWSTWKSLFASQSITALTAVGLTIPLAAGTFNLAIGTQVGVGSILAAWLLSKQGMSIPVTILLTLLSGALLGYVTAALIVWGRIDSFIATLGLSSVLTALTNWISNSQSILNLGSGYQKVATNEILGLTIPVYVTLVVAAVTWYVMERTRAGRRIYATGGNIDAARLAGVRTAATIFLCLIVCGVIAAAAGVLESSELATGDPTIGPAYLLPAFAAAFLGSTQFRPGRYNVWGTLFAVLLLGMGVTGLQLAGAPVWIPDLFNGVALLIAVGLAKRQGSVRIGAAGWLRGLRQRGPDGTSDLTEAQ